MILIMNQQLITGDRRRSTRFKHELELEFTYSNAQGMTRVGHGVTCDLARESIRFKCDDQLASGAEVELRIAWPFLLQGKCPLELIVTGPVIGTTERGTVMNLRTYEFRTCGPRSFFEVADQCTNSLVA